MTGGDRSHGYHLHFARPLVVAAFLLQRVGDAAVLYSTSLPTSPHPALRGLAIGALVCTVVMFVGVWRRMRWVRYVLVTFSWLYAFGLSLVGLEFWREYSFERFDPRSLPLVAAAFYLAATAILVRSRRVRHYANR